MQYVSNHDIAQRLLMRIALGYTSIYDRERLIFQEKKIQIRIKAEFILCVFSRRIRVFQNLFNSRMFLRIEFSSSVYLSRVRILFPKLAMISVYLSKVRKLESYVC